MHFGETIRGSHVVAAIEGYMPFSDIKVELVSSWGSDRNVAEAAWASSTDKSKLIAKTDADVLRLVKSVVELSHDTPKERIFFDFFITCPLFVERQLDKYRCTTQMQDFRVEFEMAPFGRNGITQNELSGRYRTLPERTYGLPGDVSEILAKASDAFARDCQGEDFDLDRDCILALEHQQAFNMAMVQQHRAYQVQLDLLKNGERLGAITNADYRRAREVLRGRLGTAFLTDMRLVMNLNALEHIMDQRLSADTQLETRYTAHLMLQAAWESGVAHQTLQAMQEKHGWEELGQDILAKVATSDAIS